jgi:hypothetical protein
MRCWRGDWCWLAWPSHPSIHPAASSSASADITSQHTYRLSASLMTDLLTYPPTSLQRFVPDQVCRRDTRQRPKAAPSRLVLTNILTAMWSLYLSSFSLNRQFWSETSLARRVLTNWNAHAGRIGEMSRRAAGPMLSVRWIRRKKGKKRKKRREKKKTPHQH